MQNKQWTIWKMVNMQMEMTITHRNVHRFVLVFLVLTLHSLHTWLSLVICIPCIPCNTYYIHDIYPTVNYVIASSI